MILYAHVEPLLSKLMWLQIPAHQPLWPDWNATKKDAMLSRLFKAKIKRAWFRISAQGVVEKRLAKELNVTPKEFVEIHLLSNKECPVPSKIYTSYTQIHSKRPGVEALQPCGTHCAGTTSPSVPWISPLVAPVFLRRRGERLTASVPQGL